VAHETPKRLQAALMRIRGDHPFLGTLALFTEIRITDHINTAATDGRVLWFNPRFVDKLGVNQLCGLVVHELLHAALQHVHRRRERDIRLWNIAADIVVNGMIRSDTAYDLPDGGVEISTLAHLSVEEIYEQFAAGKHNVPSINLLDLLPELSVVDGDVGGDFSPGSGHGCLDQARGEHLERHWRAALQQASAVARRMNRGFGKQGLNGVREFDSATNSILSWREILWQFMVATPYDFGGFDRRFIYRKLYLEDVIGESVEVAICIDTSASIGDRELSAFSSEIRAILDAYPQIRGTLFFADASLYGPHEFNLASGIPSAKGGGGTSFVPFFDWVHQQELSGSQPLCIYFTDGFGSFPATSPALPVLWVVLPGGLESPSFPFGEVTRMQEHT
jgi:predicted metal-dependent peptidase